MRLDGEDALGLLDSRPGLQRRLELLGKQAGLTSQTLLNQADSRDIRESLSGVQVRLAHRPRLRPQDIERTA